MKFSLISIVLSCFITILSATNLAYAYSSETYVFKDEVTKKRYQALVKELRCPKCQNQNLADSNSPIAKDLKREVYELLEQGKADIEIVDFMVKRYGEFVLYRPRVSQLTYVLWFGPIVLLLIGGIAITVIVRKKPAKKASSALNERQRAQLNDILKDK